MAKSVLAANPLRKLRRNCNLTQGQLAELANVSEKSVYLSECGVYELPVESISQYFARNRGIDIDNLNNEYIEFRHKMRASLKNAIDPSAWRFSIPVSQVNSYRTPFNTKMAPIKDFYINSLLFTHQEFIKGFLVNPGLLYKLEHSYLLSVPRTINEALIECGAPNEFIRDLDVRTKLFHTPS